MIPLIHLSVVCIRLVVFRFILLHKFAMLPKVVLLLDLVN